MKLSNENIEEYLLLLADNELEQAEEQEVRLYVSEHQDYKPMLDAYLACRLDSTEPFIFPDKESLLQPETVVVPLKKTGFKPLKLVAAVAVLLGLGVAFAIMFSKGDKIDNTNSIAAKGHAIKHKTVQPIINQSDSLYLAQVQKKEQKMTKSPDRKHQQGIQQASQMAVAEQGPAHESIPVPAYLESAALNNIPTGVGVQGETIVMVQNENTEELSHKAIPEWLPVNEENLQGLNSIIAHIQVLKENLLEKTKAFKNTAFVLRIGDKQIMLSKPSN